MRRSSMALLLLFAVGCSSSLRHPAVSYKARSDAFSAAVETLTKYKRAGKIDAHTSAKITPFIHAGDKAFDNWRKAIESATDEDGDGRLDVDVSEAVRQSVLDALDQLLMWIAKVEATDPPVETMKPERRP